MLKHPTKELIENEREAFFLEEKGAEEAQSALTTLFATFRQNSDISHIYTKVITLNQLFSTRILSIDLLPLSRHIKSLNVDSSLEKEDLGLIRKIYTCPPLKNYYSFATKYCSWHNQDVYPIYDSYVDESLWAYRGQGQFIGWRRHELGNYERFVEIVRAFKKSFQLEDVSFRDLDKFLWVTGKRLLKAKEEIKKARMLVI